VEDITAKLLDRAERRCRIEGFRRVHHRGRVRETAEVSHHHSEEMIERYRDADAGARLDARRLADEEAVVEKVMVRQRRALRQSGGAARELNVDGVIHLDAD